MATGYYLVDNPNPVTAQYGWPRSRVSGVIGIHTAENNTCFGGPDPGDTDVAGFISRRTDYGSYHTLCDADSRNPLVPPAYAAWADTTNNAHAMSVSAAVRANDWAELGEERSRAVLLQMAYAAAELTWTAVEQGLQSEVTPARRISAAEAISGSRAGFYGHGETNPGTRYDPGAGFDWDTFLDFYQTIIDGNEIGEDDMSGAALSEHNIHDKDGNETSVEKVLISLDTKLSASLQELREARQEQLQTKAAVSGLLATEFEDPSEPGKFYKFADFVVWGATNAKAAAGAAGKQGELDPKLLAEAFAVASTGVTAEKVAELLQANTVVSVKKEGEKA